MNAKSPSLEIIREFDAPPDRVFEAWIDPSQFTQWAGPGEIKGEVTLLEPRVGGRYRILMRTPDGKNPVVSGVYKEIAKPSRLVFTWKWDHGTDETVVTLLFRAVGGKTELTLRHEGFTSAEDAGHHTQGWNGCLDKLGPYLKTGKSQN